MGGYYYGRSSSRGQRSHERMLDLILRQGEASAEGALRTGDILAGTLGDLGRSYTQHEERAREQAMLRRREEYQRGIDSERSAREAASDAREEARSRREDERARREAEEFEQKRKEREALEAAYREAQGGPPARPGATPGATPQAGTTRSGIDIEGIASRLPAHMQTEFRKSVADANAAALKYRQSQDDYFARLALGVKPHLGDPQSAATAIEIALRHAEEAGVQGVDAYRQQIAADPSRLGEIIQSLIDRSPEVSKEARGRRQTVTVQGPNGPMAKLATEEELERGVPLYREPKAAPRPNLERIETIDPATGKTVVKFVEPKVGDSYAKPTGAARPSTGQQRKALNFFNRGKEAHEIATALEEAGKVGATAIKAAGKVPFGAGNFALGDENQAYVQAQRAFTEARLRKESGATVKDNEYAEDAETYFEQPGDSPLVKAQKRAGRNAILAGIAFETGDALKEFYGDEAEGMLEGYRTKTNLKSEGAKVNPFRKGNDKKTSSNPFRR